MSVPIGLQLYTLRERMAQDVAGTLRAVAEIGYAGVETAFFEGVSPREAARQLRDLQLTVFSAHTALPVGDDLDGVLRLADDLGCRRIVWHGWPRDPRYDSVAGIMELADLFNAANRNVVAHGLTFGIHNHWWECMPVEGQYPYRILMEQLDPAIFFEPDAYWAQVAGLDPAAFVAELGARAPLLHLKDGPARPDEPMTALGTGVLDLAAIVEAGAGATEWAIVELDEVAGDMLDAVRASYGYMTSHGLGRGRL